ncbi:hypothetical protein WN51_00466 [Melipona quadrifasciata]|uniref:Uncharacterized protein n=1 Tax=Melipona quadrifasciata TaxID=166423 RepID=A0A0M9A2A3_9HYME|nr:hypothetical protein WN51_00466 [Melipona quadrifasciata]
MIAGTMSETGYSPCSVNREIDKQFQNIDLVIETNAMEYNKFVNTVVVCPTQLSIIYGLNKYPAETYIIEVYTIDASLRVSLFSLHNFSSIFCLEI